LSIGYLFPSSDDGAELASAERASPTQGGILRSPEKHPALGTEFQMLEP
jgi:hypothetical protein